MSGGSFNYLCYKDFPAEESELRAMVKFLREHDMPEAAAATAKFLEQPSEELRGLWKAVEWFVSSDWWYDEINEANNRFLGIEE
jgi:hypothetical protein